MRESFVIEDDLFVERNETAEKSSFYKAWRNIPLIFQSVGNSSYILWRDSHNSFSFLSKHFPIYVDFLLITVYWKNSSKTIDISNRTVSLQLQDARWNSRKSSVVDNKFVILQ